MLRTSSAYVVQNSASELASPKTLSSTRGVVRISSSANSARVGSHPRGTPLPQASAHFALPETPLTTGIASGDQLGSKRIIELQRDDDASQAQEEVLRHQSLAKALVSLSLSLAPSLHEPSSQTTSVSHPPVVVWTTDDDVTTRRSWTAVENDNSTSASRLASGDSASTNVCRKTSALTMVILADSVQESVVETHRAGSRHVQQVIKSVSEVELFIDRILQLCVLERDNLDAELATKRAGQSFNNIVEPLVKLQ